MTDENPYQSPQALEAQQPLDGELYVDGPHLIIKSGVRLPPRCVVTNQPLSEKDVTKHKLRWTGNSFQFMLDAKHCTVFWAIAPSIRRRQRITVLLSLALHAGFIGCSIFLLTDPGNFPVGFVVLLLMWIVLIVLVGRWHAKTPQITQYQHGYFWIGGCGANFLASLDASI